MRELHLPGWKGRASRSLRRWEARLERRRELFEEQLLMVDLLRMQVNDEGKLAPESADFLHGLLLNMRLNLELAPSGDQQTDALQQHVLYEVARLVKEIQARTR